MNYSIFLGRLTKDPELRKTNSNDIPVCNFTLAVDRRVKAGEPKIADFIDFVAWREIAVNICKFCHRGDPIIVTGKVQNKKYTDKDGNQRMKYEVAVDNFEFIPRKKMDANGSNENSEEPQPEEETANLPF